MDDLSRLANEIPKDSTVTLDLIKKFLFQTKGNLQPIASIIGGIMAQEGLKGVCIYINLITMNLVIAYTSNHSN